MFAGHAQRDVGRRLAGVADPQPGSRRSASSSTTACGLFKISTHYGVDDLVGRVYTDIAGEGQRLNRVAAKLSPIARLALQRFSRSLSGAPRQGTRDIWLCHTLCELGATRMVDFLGVIQRFLELNPDQVIILFDEDYVAERDIQKAFVRAGLFADLATLQPGPAACRPWAS